jgi:protein-S-isoprenylcysteine O-methyltransferase Ste14
MRIYDQIIVACWIAFFGVWLVMSLIGGRSSGRSSASSSAIRLVLFLGLVGVMRYGGQTPALTFTHRFAGLPAAGSVVCAIGAAFAIWARVALGRNWGMPMTLHAQPELVTSGPYAYVRHPIYTGVIAMFIGTALVYPLAAVPGAAMSAYFLFSARREERDMARRFPDTYPAYKLRSKMLVPFVL